MTAAVGKGTNKQQTNTFIAKYVLKAAGPLEGTAFIEQTNKKDHDW